MSNNTLNVRLKQRHDTTANWAVVETTFVPLAGEIIIYDDYKQITQNGVVTNVPGVKVGDGNVYLADLPFVDAAIMETLTNHIEDSSIHFTVNSADDQLIFANPKQSEK